MWNISPHFSSALEALDRRIVCKREISGDDEAPTKKSHQPLSLRTSLLHLQYA